MKKRTLLCGALLAGTLLCAAGAADAGSLSPMCAKNYLEKLDALEQTYGSSHHDEGMPCVGLVMAKLIDFDGDSTPELYCAYGSAADAYHQVVYTIGAGGAAYPLWESDHVSNFSTDVAPEACFYQGQSVAYLKDGREVDNGGKVNFYTKQGDRWVSVLSYSCRTNGGSGHHGEANCALDGFSCTEEHLQQQLARFTAGFEQQSYSFWVPGYDVPDALSITPTVAEVRNTLRAVAGLPAMVQSAVAPPSTATVRVNGKPATLAGYEIGGNNFYKLRDLAYALIGTEKEFGVGWDPDTRTIDFGGAQGYVAVGGEGQPVPGGSRTATRSTVSMRFGGVPVTIDAYEVAGNNYFKLRDLAALLDFGITWDGDTKTIDLLTTAGYTP